MRANPSEIPNLPMPLRLNPHLLKAKAAIVGSQLAHAHQVKLAGRALDERPDQQCADACALPLWHNRQRRQLQCAVIVRLDLPAAHKLPVVLGHDEPFPIQVHGVDADLMDEGLDFIFVVFSSGA